MKEITFTNAHRRAHFEFFNGMNHPHFNLCANVDITDFLRRIKAENLPFTPAMVWRLSKCANDIPEFRQRIRGEKIVEHEAVHPSFSTATDEADVFSFCEVKYQPDEAAFIADAKNVIEKMRTDPIIEDEPGRDDYLFLSSIPWVSFTGLTHAMSYHPHDSVPRITWGKYFTQGEKIMMPLAVQVHHALVDGRHVGRYFQAVETFTRF